MGWERSKAKLGLREAKVRNGRQYSGEDAGAGEPARTPVHEVVVGARLRFEDGLLAILAV